MITRLQKKVIGLTLVALIVYFSIFSGTKLHNETKAVQMTDLQANSQNLAQSTKEHDILNKETESTAKKENLESTSREKQGPIDNVFGISEYENEDCYEYFEKKYRENPNWSNLRIVNFEGDHDQAIAMMTDVFKGMYLFHKCLDLNQIYPDIFPRLYPIFKGRKMQMFQGKGIVMTFGPEHVQMAKRSICVIRMFSNIPIEVFHHNELPNELDLGKNVKVINVAEEMGPGWNPVGFYNKWLALLFTSFEEVIFMDADAVLFVPPERLFEMYDGTTLMFKDRHLKGMAQMEGCPRLFGSLPKSVSVTPTGKTYGDQDVRDRFFGEQNKEVIDSGLFVINKRRQYASILAGQALHQLIPAQECIWGDKEHIWLGHVFMNQPISVHPEEVSILGDMKDGVICSTMISHTEQGELIWVNGGLQRCKFESWYEFEEIKFLNDFYGLSKDELPAFYKGHDSFSQVVITNSSIHSWFLTDFCRHRYYCMPVQNLYMYPYENLYKQHIDAVTERWYQAI